MHTVVQRLRQIAPTSATVLITGESGTGKELVAKALHTNSPRRSKPFVALNCAALSENILESELFGHVRGAFTDARTARRGLFGEADGGTLFLDEVGELSPPAQVKLLRVLQEGEIRPVGESRAERVDVRLIAATLRDLERRVERGEFREDLYYRLNVVNVHVPPLRERAGDVLLLARAFLSRFNRELARPSPLLGLSPEAEALLLSYGWPGNVRELENAMERAVLLAEGSWVLPQNLPERLESPPSGVSPPTPVPTRPTPDANLSLKQAIRQLEESYIRAALRQTRGNRTRAAEVLEISPRALLYKIKEYGIDADAEGGRG
jgi:two-component system, NtrC family, response regulator AtoC